MHRVDKSSFSFGDKEKPATTGLRAANGADKDADQVLQDYLALPLSERSRFMLMWNQSEEDFDVPALKKLNAHVEKQGVDTSNRSAFETLLTSLGSGILKRVTDESSDEDAADGLHPRKGSPAAKLTATGIPSKVRGRVKGATHP